jgi:hypothetical protein
MSIVYLLAVALMGITVLVLVAGLVLMASGSQLNTKYSNYLMTARVSCQALVVILLLLSFFLHH